MQFFRLTALAVVAAVELVSSALGASDLGQELGLPAEAAIAMKSIDAERIRAHVRFSSDDLLEGRGTGARGGDLAAKYVGDDYTAKHYHQPSDEYSPAMDFWSNASLAKFGFALGWQALLAGGTVNWLPGDEFEATRLHGDSSR